MATNSIANAFGGNYIKLSLAEFMALKDKPEETRTAEEIIDGISAKLSALESENEDDSL